MVKRWLEASVMLQFHDEEDLRVGMCQVTRSRWKVDSYMARLPRFICDNPWKPLSTQLG